MAEKEPYQFQLDTDLRARAKKLADKRGISLAALVNLAISEKLDREEV